MAPRPSISVALQLPLPFLLPSAHRCLPSTSKRGIRSIKDPRPDRFNIGHGLPVLTSSTAAALARKEYTTPHRAGALATKKGMTAVYDTETGDRTPCTVLQIDRCEVVAHKRRDRHGYWAVQIGTGWKHPSNVTRPMLGYFEEKGVSPKRHLAEFKVKNEKGLPAIGTAIGSSWFREGDWVDVRADSRGMGFAGGMKKHGWAGQPASHGNSLSHRVMGSAGGSQGSGSRVIPGKAMPGRMGGERVTVQNLKVMKVDPVNGLVLVSGCVPGPKKGIVKVSDAILKSWPEIGQDPPSVLAAAQDMREGVSKTTAVA